MSSDWTIISLDSLMEFGNGKTKPKTEGEIPIYGGNGILGYCDQFNYEDETLIIGRVGAYCGAVYREEKPIWISDNAIAAKPKNDYDSKYLFYLLKKLNINQFAIGSSQPLITQTLLKSLDVMATSNISEQKAIAHILGTLDDKIELNRKMNETLEQMVQALFKSWFVDFDPVLDNAIAKGNSIPDALKHKIEKRKEVLSSGKYLPDGKAGKALPKEIMELFPSSFEFNDELDKWIPEGWDVKTIDEVTSEIIDHRGKTPKKLGSDWVKEGYPAISAKNIKNGLLIRPDMIRFVDEELYRKWMKVEIEKGDIIMTSEAPMGELFLIKDETKYCLSQRLYALRANNEDITTTFFFYWLKSDIARADLEGRCSGTTVTGIKQSELRKVLTLVPSINVLLQFETKVKSLSEKINITTKQIESLTQQRDVLLPQLISGKLKVSEVIKN